MFVICCTPTFYVQVRNIFFLLHQKSMLKCINAIKWRWKLEKKARDLYYIIFCCKWWKKVWGLMSSKIWISWGKQRKGNLWLVAEGAASLHQVVLYDTNLTSNQVKMLFMIMQEFGNNQVWRPLHWLIGESHFAFGGKFYETAEVAHRYWTIISNQSTMHIVASCQHTSNLSFFFTRAKFLENKIYTEKRQFFALNL